MRRTSPFITRRIAVMAISGAAAFGREPIRVGCQTRAYGSPLPERSKFLAALDGLRRAGYDGFETNFRSVEKYFDSRADEMREEIASCGVEMIGLHVGVGFFEPAKVEAEIALVRRVARGVHALGGKHIIVSGRKLPHDSSGRAEEAALSSKARHLNEAGKFCRDLGITLSSHNHTHEVQHNADEIRRLLAKIEPNAVDLLFDIGHVHNDEVNIPELVDEYSNRIAGLHVRDVKDGEEVLIGTGKVDFASLGDALKRNSWSGWVIVEVNKRDDISSHDLVLRARKHLKQTMGI